MHEFDDATSGDGILDHTPGEDAEVLPGFADVDDEAGTGGNVGRGIDGYVRG